MIGVKDLQKLIVETMQDARPEPLPSETVPLDAALGRVLADDVVARVDLPSFEVSAMDGYAIKGGAEAGARFDIIGRSVAGRGFQGSTGPGETVRIMTGAPLPADLDTVVMQENVEKDGDRITLTKSAIPKDNVRHRGEEIASGDVILGAGKTLGAADVMLLATQGLSEVSVRGPVRVGVMSTGDELREPGRPLDKPEAIYDSNRHMLMAKLRSFPVEIVDLGNVKDDPEEIRRRLSDAAPKVHALITTGGVSVGDTDYLREVVEELGVIHQYKVALKPGKPLVFGRVGEAWYFGLPGNPVSGFVGFDLFVERALAVLLGAPIKEPLVFRAKLLEGLSKKKGRVEYRRGVYEIDEEGRASVRPMARQDSHRVLGASMANAYIVLPEDELDLRAGEEVLCRPFRDPTS